MKPLNITLDMDLVLVDPSLMWWRWLENVFDYSPDITVLQQKENIAYNLAKYFPEEHRRSPISPLEFWEDPFLYDKLSPIEGAVEGVKKFIDEGHNVRIASVCFKGHFSSKVRHIKRHYPFLCLGKDCKNCGFYATKEKGGIISDVIVDDRNEHLNQFDDTVIKVLYPTPYTQDVSLDRVPDIAGKTWKDGLADLILDLA